MSIAKDEFFKILQYARGEQSKIIPIFKSFYKLCEINNIEFSLCEGSLLGCIRHGGFVPWDDDIDIYMSSYNFDKLVKHIDYSEIELKENGLLYFYKNKKSKYKIDIFLSPFKSDIYNVRNYTKKIFEKYVVDVPCFYESILDKIYPNWQDVCYISNHKISIEKHKTWYAYLNYLTHLYDNIPTNLAKDWVEEYDKK
jgi:hypothetical protein